MALPPSPQREDQQLWIHLTARDSDIDRERGEGGREKDRQDRERDRQTERERDRDRDRERGERKRQRRGGEMQASSGTHCMYSACSPACLARRWNQRGWLGLNARDENLDRGLKPTRDVDADNLPWKVSGGCGGACTQSDRDRDRDR